MMFVAEMELVLREVEEQLVGEVVLSFLAVALLLFSDYFVFLSSVPTVLQLERQLVDNMELQL